MEVEPLNISYVIFCLVAAQNADSYSINIVEI